MSLHDSIARAKKRHQPYINLTNEKYQISDIFNKEIIESFKKLDLKSLYFRTDKLALTKEFAEHLHQLIAGGLREIFTFCDKELSNLTMEDFNAFLKEHNIRINFNVAQLSETDVAQITTDSIGKKDMLGFIKIENYHIVYGNDWKVALLNSRESDALIQGNYQNYKHKVADDFAFGVKEPKYIKTSTDPEPDVRATKLSNAKASIAFEAQMQLNTNVDLSADQELKQENELDIDQDQLANKFDHYSAVDYTKKMLRSQFIEEYLITNSPLGSDSYYKIGWLFNGNTQINYITKAALDLMIPHLFLFHSGINLNNMPIGLAFKEGIIFASEKRPNSMPIDEFTVNFDYIRPTISDPLAYSWLYFATKGSISLNDVYGSKDAPKLIGEDQHLAIKWGSGDIMLDIPYNNNHRNYKIDWTEREYAKYISYNIDDLRLFSKQTKVVELDNAFPELSFHHLTDDDKQRLQDIWQQLKARGIEIHFRNILLSTEIKNGEFLLEEKTAVFLNRLFHDILPITKDNNKLLFFQKTLSSFVYTSHDDKGNEITSTYCCKLSARYSLEDIFEGLNASYKKLQEFLLVENIDSEAQKLELTNAFQTVLKNQLSETTSYKVAIARVFSILELNSKNGGNLNEQIEYLALKHGTNLANDPKILINAEQHNQNIIHPAIQSLGPVVSPESLIKANSDIDPKTGINIALRYLSTLAPNQRASVDTYSKYLNYLQIAAEMQTSDYIRKEILKNNKTKTTDLETAANRIASVLRQLLNAEEKDSEQVMQYAYPGVLTSEINLVNNFTTNQAYENLRLLTLNIISSSRRHYNQQYPDQEFSAYASLFSLIFDPIKVKNPIEIGYTKLMVEEHFNAGIARIKDTATIMHEKDSDIKEKEDQHKNIIGKFLRVYEENPEFNFGEVVALGLIANFNELSSNDAIKQAKELLQYGPYLYQLFRVLIASTSKSELTDLEELKARVDNIINSLSFLTSDMEGNDGSTKIHEFLTDHGSKPENLALFAACFGQKTEVQMDELKELVNKIAQLTPQIKEQLLNSLASTKLPFANHVIVENSKFPILTLDILDNPQELNTIIEQASMEYVSYDEATLFNETPKSKLYNIKPDLSILESNYGIIFTDELKSLSFAHLKQAIIKDPKFIENNIYGQVLQDDIGKMEFDFVSELFATITLHTNSWQTLHAKAMKLLFNPAAMVAKQLSQIDYNKSYLDDLLARCANMYDKTQLLDLLLESPSIPHGQQREILTYLRSIPVQKLKELDLTIPSFLNLVPKSLYIENFPLFKLATDFALKNTLSIPLQEFYQLIEPVSGIKSSTEFFGKILNYCQEHNEFSLLYFISNLNSKSKNFGAIIEWLTSLKAEDVKQLSENANLDLKLMFEIIDINKIKEVVDIALKLDQTVAKDQYDMIIKHIAKHKLDEAKLLKSYLLAPNKSLSAQTKIEFVLDNLSSINKAQTLFSETNLARFSYDSERVMDKIAKIVHKNSSTALTIAEQKEIYTRFVAVMEKSKVYKDFDYNELHDKSLELKHARRLHKDDNPEIVHNLDSEFIALTAEIMYRETGKSPRDTQLLSVLNIVNHNEHLIEEIATGQGKSIITALTASYLWFTGQTVDVTTSSRNLAERDLADFSSFYDALGIKHGDSIITTESSIEDYKKSGVNYGVASDLALFRADREFHSNKHDISLNADVSIVCDEVDAILTSDVNFKLATLLVNTNQEETRVLFGYILEFSELPAFKNLNISSEADVENLVLFLNYQFEKYDSSLHFPLNAVQLDKLIKTGDPIANKLYVLNHALLKCSKDQNKLFDKLLDSVSVAANLEKGVDFVVLPIEDNEEQLFKAVPIVKTQPHKDTVFGDGVQPFVHLLLEQQYPELSMKFEISPPAVTIFNISPKTFFDYYRLTGGRIIGLTGTAGSKIELEEFAEINKIIAFSIPKFETEQKEFLPDIEVKNLEAQYNKTIEILETIDTDRPILVFCDSTKHAEAVYELVKSKYETVQLSAASQLDTDTSIKVVERAGNNRIITITTPMLGRGTDFFTNHPKGYFAINLCTYITWNVLWQIYGRIARNGNPGTAISIFNQDVYAKGVKTPMEHMEFVSCEERTQRMRSQPLTDLLKYFGNLNHDETLNAILANEFITKSWNKLLAMNDKAIPNEQRLMPELRKNLVEIVKTRYPQASKNLEAYLQHIDEDRHESASKAYKADYVAQPQALEPAIFTESSFMRDAYGYWKLVSNLGTSKPTFHVQKPTATNGYSIFYQNYIQANNVKMLTHSFAIENNLFTLTNSFTAKFTKNSHTTFDTVVFSVSYNGHLLAHIKNTKYPVTILSNDWYKQGIAPVLFDKIKSYQNSPDKIILLTTDEIQEIRYYIWEHTRISYWTDSNINGEGSQGSLMLDEFKQSFAAYKALANSAEVNNLGNLVDNFRPIQKLDFTKLESGKYQAINIVTKFDSLSSHAESILTDGKFLFWVNRGAGANQGAGISDGSGIKIFKITKDLDQVKKVLNDLKETKSQTDTRNAIYSLLREDNDYTVPKFVLVPMKPQKIGNCGWVQVKSMLKALGIVGHIGILQELPDIESQEWQKAIKNADDIYNDFVTFDHIVRAEALLYSLDQEFKPQFLDAPSQKAIDDVRQFVKEPAPQKLLEELTKKLTISATSYSDTIYEDQYHIVISKLQVETALASKMGLALQMATDYATAKTVLKSYQEAYLGDFDELNKIYSTIGASRLEDKAKQNELLKKLAEFITQESIALNDITQLTDNLTNATTSCAADNKLNEHCILSKFTSEYGQDLAVIERGGQCPDLYHGLFGQYSGILEEG